MKPETLLKAAERKISLILDPALTPTEEEIRQDAFFSRSWPQIASHLSKDWSVGESLTERNVFVLMKTLEVLATCHQTYGPLLGRVQVIIPPVEGVFESMLRAYYAFAGRSVSVYMASYLSQNEMRSWGAKGTSADKVFDTDVSVVFRTSDLVMESAKMKGFVSSLGNHNAGKTACIFAHTSPLYIPPGILTQPLNLGPVLDFSELISRALSSRRQK